MRAEVTVETGEEEGADAEADDGDETAGPSFAGEVLWLMAYA